MSERGLELGTFCSRERYLNRSATAPQIDSLTVIYRATGNQSSTIYICHHLIFNAFNGIIKELKLQLYNNGELT